MSELDSADAVADGVYALHWSLITVVYIDESLGVLKIRISLQDIVTEYSGGVRPSAYAHQDLVCRDADLLALLVLKGHDELVAVLFYLLHR